MNDQKQREIDISNLRFYANCFREHQWETDVVSWTVFAATLDEVADRLSKAESKSDSVSPLTPELFSRPECCFMYCAHPEECQEACVHGDSDHD